MKATINEQLLKFQAEVASIVFGIGEEVEVVSNPLSVRLSLAQRILVISTDLFSRFMESTTMFATRLYEKRVSITFRVIDDQLYAWLDDLSKRVPLRPATEFMTRISEQDVEKAVHHLYRQGDGGTFEGSEAVSLNARMRQLRGKRTYREVSEATGISQSYLSDMENSPRAIPSLSALQAIANYYQLTVSDILRGVTIDRQYEPVPRMNLPIRNIHA